MSSATLQSAPHQSTSVASHSPVAATSAYTTGSPQSRDPYYAQSPTNALPSTRRPSRRPSANDSPQQPQHYPPSTSAPAPAVATRGLSSDHASPVLAADAPTERPVMAPGDHQRGVPPVVSPRTSSNRSAAHAATDRPSKRAGYANDPAASPRLPNDSQPDRQRSNGNTQVNGADKGDDASPATSASRSRRRAADSPRDVLPSRPSGGREPRTTHSASAVQDRRPAPTTGASTAAGLSREGSEILNRVIISRPEVDIDREQARMAEAIPSSPASNRPTSPIGVLSVVGSEGVEDGARGPRSRHDHSSSSKPEKSSSKFGDYFLGNTLGEGEFGKVKMGWKQEGGVQVSSFKLLHETD